MAMMMAVAEIEGGLEKKQQSKLSPLKREKQKDVLKWALARVACT